MTPEWIYLLKVNVGIALFYGFYKLFCCKDTFFRWRRIALLSFLVVSFLCPLLNVQHWVQEQPAMNELADYYAAWMYEEEATVTAAPVMKLPDALTVWNAVYLAGIGVLCVRFLIQLLSIFRLVWKGKRMEVDGVQVISLPMPVNPFSFFRWIFVHLPQLEGEGRKEILMHELTHVRQRHSLDVVFSELVNIVCWMNPFMWLLKAEIRLNLEYLADNKVAESVVNTKEYQYHLLGLANQNRQTGLYNHFNVSHLKNRIVMMNKKRTRTTGRIKYALFAPLAAALLLVSNIESVARTTERIAKDVVSNFHDAVEQSTDTVVFQVVEEMPEFPGGMAACMQWLKDNIKYPKEAQDKAEQGRVIIQFTVEKDGTLSNFRVARPVSPALDAEALRVTQAMPTWKPGKQRGQAVRTRYTLPVLFSLAKENSEAASKEPKAIEVNQVFQVVENMPEFPGGMPACMQWLKDNMQYPKEAQEKKESGRVIVQFIVEADGSVSNAKIVRGISPSIDAESLRLVNAMPKWKPGTQGGQAVKVKYTLPIRFAMEGVSPMEAKAPEAK